MSVVFLAFTVGCDFHTYVYDCRGALKQPDGIPASCTMIHIDTSGPP